jgi:DMSO reductase anchor subunit
MEAPEVLSVMPTVCREVNEPVAGVMAGVAAGDGDEMVITEAAVALVEKLAAVAMAFTVVVVLTLNGAVYGVEDVVGWPPSRV